MFHKRMDLILKVRRSLTGLVLLKAHEVPFRTTMQMSWELVQTGTNQLGAPNSPAVRYGDETLFAAEVESLIHAHFQNKYQKKICYFLRVSWSSFLLLFLTWMFCANFEWMNDCLISVVLWFGFWGTVLLVSQVCVNAAGLQNVPVDMSKNWTRAGFASRTLLVENGAWELTF